MAYRFRSWSEAGKAPFAGNFVVIDPSATRRTLLMLGVTGDLSRASEMAQEAVGEQGDHLYVRLNVARAVRRHEHDDLVAAHPAAVVVDTDS